LPEFNDLTKSQADLLFKILELQQSARTSRITNKLLAEETKMAEGTVRRIANRLVRVAQQYGYLDVHNIKSGKQPGRPKHHYLLNPKKIVTLPETALLLLELLKFPEKMPLLIDRAEFEKHLISVHGIEARLVPDRIVAAMEIGYIETEYDGLIYPSQRTSCERLYLELLVRNWNESSPDAF
jgi:hypothetical protein